MPTHNRRINGAQLNVFYGRKARQARYRENGVWYNQLITFPADLYDANGVIRFDSDAEYRKKLRIGPDPDHIHADLAIYGIGISTIPGYTLLHPPPSTVREIRDETLRQQHAPTKAESTTRARGRGQLIHLPEKIAEDLRAKLDEKNPGWAFTPEFEGRRKKYTLGTIEAVNRHGTVVNALYGQLRSAGLNAACTKAIDLLLHKDGIITHIFEVKVTPNTSSIYAAVGQVMLHALSKGRSANRIIVLPGRLKSEAERRIAALGIKILRYDWDFSDTSLPRFHDLLKIVGG